MENKNLEEIFWREGKWINGKNEEVKPEPIGSPKLLSLTLDMSLRLLEEDSPLNKENLRKISQVILPSNKSSEINAYSIIIIPNSNGINIPTQFYKI